MAELDDRLIRCVSSVFPNLSEEDIQASDVAQLMEADSLAAVTLVAVLDEEFGLNLDLEGLVKLGSFQALQRHLRERGFSSLRADE